jgi:surface antigen-like variable number repeat protein
MRKAALLIALFLPLVSLLTAQKTAGAGKTASVSASKLVAVKVTGTDRYTDKEILAASGLELGRTASDANFKEAVKRLGDTGLFTDVAYSYSYSPAGAKLEFQLVDTDKSKLVPAHYENFVWFTDAELTSEIQRRVPLFKQALPLAGSLPDQVSEALQVILGARHLPGRVDYLRESKPGTGEAGDLIGIAYRVEEANFYIHDVEFPGAGPDQLPALKAAAHKLIGAEYVRSSLAIVAGVDYLPVYLQRGYLKAAFAQADARVATQTSTQVQVDAIFPVTPGKIYSTSSVAWKGNAALPVDQLQSLLHLPLAQPADAVRLASDLENVQKLYHTKGYMAARIQAEPRMDDAASTVHYDLCVVEGDLFQMGELEIVGLDSQAKASLQNAWTLREGQTYNSDYPKEFLKNAFRLLPHAEQWAVDIREAVNAKDKTVDVTLRFTSK